jgi:hypothetical protein
MHLFLALGATIVFSSCTSTKLLIDREINQENLSSQLNPDDLIKVTTTESDVQRIRVIHFENANIVGRVGSKGSERANIVIPYTQIDKIELKKVNGVKLALGLFVVAGIITALALSGPYGTL